MANNIFKKEEQKPQLAYNPITGKLEPIEGTLGQKLFEENQTTVPIYKQAVEVPDTEVVTKGISSRGINQPPVVDLYASTTNVPKSVETETDIVQETKQQPPLQPKPYPFLTLPEGYTTVGDILKQEPKERGVKEQLASAAIEGLKTLPRTAINLIGHVGDIYYNTLNGLAAVADVLGLDSSSIRRFANKYAPSGTTNLLEGGVLGFGGNKQAEEMFLKEASPIEKMLYHLSKTLERNPEYMVSEGSIDKVTRALFGATEGIAPMAIDIAAAFVSGGGTAPLSAGRLAIASPKVLKAFGTMNLILNNVLARHTESGLEQGYSTGEAMTRATVPTAANWLTLIIGGKVTQSLGNIGSRIALNPKIFSSTVANQPINSLFTKAFIGKKVGEVVGDTAIFQTLPITEAIGASISGSKQYAPGEIEEIAKMAFSGNAIFDSLVASLAYGFPRGYKQYKTIKSVKPLIEGISASGKFTQQEVKLLEDYLKTTASKTETEAAFKFLNSFFSLDDNAKIAIFERLLNDPEKRLSKRIIALSLLDSSLDLNAALGRDLADQFRFQVVKDMIYGLPIDTRLSFKDYLSGKREAPKNKPTDLINNKEVNYTRPLYKEGIVTEEESQLPTRNLVPPRIVEDINIPEVPEDLYPNETQLQNLLLQRKALEEQEKQLPIRYEEISGKEAIPYQQMQAYKEIQQKKQVLDRMINELQPKVKTGQEARKLKQEMEKKADEIENSFIEYNKAVSKNVGNKAILYTPENKDKINNIVATSTEYDAKGQKITNGKLNIEWDDGYSALMVTFTNQSGQKVQLPYIVEYKNDGRQISIYDIRNRTTKTFEDVPSVYNYIINTYFHTSGLKSKEQKQTIISKEPSEKTSKPQKAVEELPSNLDVAKSLKNDLANPNTNKGAVINKAKNFINKYIKENNIAYEGDVKNLSNEAVESIIDNIVRRETTGDTSINIFEFKIKEKKKEKKVPEKKPVTKKEVPIKDIDELLTDYDIYKQRGESEKSENFIAWREAARNFLIEKAGLDPNKVENLPTDNLFEMLNNFQKYNDVYGRNFEPTVESILEGLELRKSKDKNKKLTSIEEERLKKAVKEFLGDKDVSNWKEIEKEFNKKVIFDIGSKYESIDDLIKDFERVLDSNNRTNEEVFKLKAAASFFLESQGIPKNTDNQTLVEILNDLYIEKFKKDNPNFTKKGTTVKQKIEMLLNWDKKEAAFWKNLAIKILGEDFEKETDVKKLEEGLKEKLEFLDKFKSEDAEVQLVFKSRDELYAKIDNAIEQVKSVLLDDKEFSENIKADISGLAENLKEANIITEEEYNSIMKSIKENDASSINFTLQHLKKNKEQTINEYFKMAKKDDVSKALEYFGILQNLKEGEDLPKEIRAELQQFASKITGKDQSTAGLVAIKHILSRFLEKSAGTKGVDNVSGILNRKNRDVVKRELQNQDNYIFISLLSANKQGRNTSYFTRLVELSKQIGIDDVLDIHAVYIKIGNELFKSGLLLVTDANGNKHLVEISDKGKLNKIYSGDKNVVYDTIIKDYFGKLSDDVIEQIIPSKVESFKLKDFNSKAILGAIIRIFGIVRYLSSLKNKIISGEVDRAAIDEAIVSMFGRGEHPINSVINLANRLQKLGFNSIDILKLKHTTLDVITKLRKLSDITSYDLLDVISNMYNVYYSVKQLLGQKSPEINKQASNFDTVKVKENQYKITGKLEDGTTVFTGLMIVNVSEYNKNRIHTSPFLEEIPSDSFVVVVPIETTSVNNKKVTKYILFQTEKNYVINGNSINSIFTKLSEDTSFKLKSDFFVKDNKETLNWFSERLKAIDSSILSQEQKNAAKKALYASVYWYLKRLVYVYMNKDNIDYMGVDPQLVKQKIINTINLLKSDDFLPEQFLNQNLNPKKKDSAFTVKGIFNELTSETTTNFDILLKEFIYNKEGKLNKLFKEYAGDKEFVELTNAIKSLIKSKKQTQTGKETKKSKETTKVQTEIDEQTPNLDIQEALENVIKKQEKTTKEAKSTEETEDSTLPDIEGPSDFMFSIIDDNEGKELSKEEIDRLYRSDSANTTELGELIERVKDNKDLLEEIESIDRLNKRYAVLEEKIENGELADPFRLILKRELNKVRQEQSKKQETHISKEKEIRAGKIGLGIRYFAERIHRLFSTAAKEKLTVKDLLELFNITFYKKESIGLTSVEEVPLTLIGLKSAYEKDLLPKHTRESVKKFFDILTDLYYIDPDTVDNPISIFNGYKKYLATSQFSYKTKDGETKTVKLWKGTEEQLDNFINTASELLLELGIDHSVFLMKNIDNIVENPLVDGIYVNPFTLVKYIDHLVNTSDGFKSEKVNQLLNNLKEQLNLMPDIVENAQLSFDLKFENRSSFGSYLKKTSIFETTIFKRVFNNTTGAYRYEAVTSAENYFDMPFFDILHRSIKHALHPDFVTNFGDRRSSISFDEAYWYRPDMQHLIKEYLKYYQEYFKNNKESIDTIFEDKINVFLEENIDAITDTSTLKKYVDLIASNFYPDKSKKGSFSETLVLRVDNNKEFNIAYNLITINKRRILDENIKIAQRVREHEIAVISLYKSLQNAYKNGSIKISDVLNILKTVEAFYELPEVVSKYIELPKIKAKEAFSAIKEISEISGYVTDLSYKGIVGVFDRNVLSASVFKQHPEITEKSNRLTESIKEIYDNLYHLTNFRVLEVASGALKENHFIYKELVDKITPFANKLIADGILLEKNKNDFIKNTILYLSNLAIAEEYFSKKSKQNREIYKLVDNRLVPFQDFTKEEAVKFKYRISFYKNSLFNLLPEVDNVRSLISDIIIDNIYLPKKIRDQINLKNAKVIAGWSLSPQATKILSTDVSKFILPDIVFVETGRTITKQGEFVQGDFYLKLKALPKIGSMAPLYSKYKDDPNFKAMFDDIENYYYVKLNFNRKLFKKEIALSDGKTESLDIFRIAPDLSIASNYASLGGLTKPMFELLGKLNPDYIIETVSAILREADMPKEYHLSLKLRLELDNLLKIYGKHFQNLINNFNKDFDLFTASREQILDIFTILAQGGVIKKANDFLFESPALSKYIVKSKSESGLANREFLYLLSNDFIFNPHKIKEKLNAMYEKWYSLAKEEFFTDELPIVESFLKKMLRPETEKDDKFITEMLDVILGNKDSLSKHFADNEALTIKFINFFRNKLYNEVSLFKNPTFGVVETVLPFLESNNIVPNNIDMETISSNLKMLEASGVLFGKNITIPKDLSSTMREKLHTVFNIPFWRNRVFGDKDSATSKSIDFIVSYVKKSIDEGNIVKLRALQTLVRFLSQYSGFIDYNDAAIFDPKILKNIWYVITTGKLKLEDSTITYEHIKPIVKKIPIVLHAVAHELFGPIKRLSELGIDFSKQEHINDFIKLLTTKDLSEVYSFAEKPVYDEFGAVSHVDYDPTIIQKVLQVIEDNSNIFVQELMQRADTSIVSNLLKEFEVLNKFSSNDLSTIRQEATDKLINTISKKLNIQIEEPNPDFVLNKAKQLLDSLDEVEVILDKYANAPTGIYKFNLGKNLRNLFYESFGISKEKFNDMFIGNAVLDISKINKFVQSLRNSIITDYDILTNVMNSKEYDNRVTTWRQNVIVGLMTNNIEMMPEIKNRILKKNINDIDIYLKSRGITNAKPLLEKIAFSVVDQYRFEAIEQLNDILTKHSKTLRKGSGRDLQEPPDIVTIADVIESIKKIDYSEISNIDLAKILEYNKNVFSNSIKELIKDQTVLKDLLKLYGEIGPDLNMYFTSLSVAEHEYNFIQKMIADYAYATNTKEKANLRSMLLEYKNIVPNIEKIIKTADELRNINLKNIKKASLPIIVQLETLQTDSVIHAETVVKRYTGYLSQIKREMEAVKNNKLLLPDEKEALLKEKEQLYNNIYKELIASQEKLRSLPDKMPLVNMFTVDVLDNGLLKLSSYRKGSFIISPIELQNRNMVLTTFDKVRDGVFGPVFFSEQDTIKKDETIKHKTSGKEEVDDILKTIIEKAQSRKQLYKQEHKGRLTKEELQELAYMLTAGGSKIKFVYTKDFLDTIVPEKDREKYKGFFDTRTITGTYGFSGDTIYIFVDKLTNGNILLNTLKHEFIHRGYAIMAKDKEISQYINFLKNNKDFMMLAKKTATIFKGATDISEFFAYFGESIPKLPKIEKFKMALQRVFRNIVGLDPKLTKEELTYIAARLLEVGLDTTKNKVVKNLKELELLRHLFRNESKDIIEKVTKVENTSFDTNSYSISDTAPAAIKEHERIYQELRKYINSDDAVNIYSKISLTVLKPFTKVIDVFMGKSRLSNKLHSDIVFKELVRRIIEVPAGVTNWADITLRGLYKGKNNNEISKEQFSLINTYIVLSDLLKDIDAGNYGRVVNDKTAKELPFQVESITELREMLRKTYEALDEDSLYIIRKRRELFNSLLNDLKKYELVPEYVKDGEEMKEYFHRIIINQAKELNTKLGLGMGESLKYPFKGLQAPRTFSSLPYITNLALSDFAYLLQAKSLVETAKLLDKLRVDIDRTKFVEQIKNKNGYEKMSVLQYISKFGATDPVTGDKLYVYDLKQSKRAVIESGVLDHLFDSLVSYVVDANVKLEDIKLLHDSFMKNVEEESRYIIIPERYYNILKRFSDIKKESEIGKFWRSSLNVYRKAHTYIPLKVIGWQLNNMLGDFEATVSYPMLVTEIWRATKDLWNRYMRNKKLSPELEKELIQLGFSGTLGSSFFSQELQSYSLFRFQRLMFGDIFAEPNAIKRVFRIVNDQYRNLLTFREGILRLAAYRFFKKRLAEGKLYYGASNPETINVLKNRNDFGIDAAAEVLARELVGDYGALSEAGKYLRDHLIPFYSFLEVNFKRELKLIKNLFADKIESPDGSLKRAHLNTFGKLLSLLLITVGVKKFNDLRYPEESQQLEDLDPNNIYLIWGVDYDTKNITAIPLQSITKDFLDWFNGYNPEVYSKVYHGIFRGDMSLFEGFKEISRRPVSKIMSGIGIIKIPFELWAGKTIFPDIKRGRPIYSTVDYMAQQIGIDVFTKMYKAPESKKQQQIFSSIFPIRFYNKDEVAYYTSLKKVFDFLEIKGHEIPQVEPTNRMIALWKYKQYIKGMDVEKAQKAKEEYLKLGGTEQGLQMSLRKLNPISFIPIKFRDEFFKSLTEEERVLFNRGVKFWNEQIYSHMV